MKNVVDNIFPIVFIFHSNDKSKRLLEVLGIYTEDLELFIACKVYRDGCKEEVVEDGM